MGPAVPEAGSPATAASAHNAAEGRAADGPAADGRATHGRAPATGAVRRTDAAGNATRKREPRQRELSRPRGRSCPGAWRTPPRARPATGAAGSDRPRSRRSATAPSRPAAAPAAGIRRWSSGVTRSGSAPSSLKIARVNSNQVVAPALVPCSTPPGTSAPASSSSPAARSADQVGEPVWSSTTAMRRQLLLERAHRLDEVPAGRAVDPGRAHHVRTRMGRQHGQLARQLARPVHRLRAGRIGRLVRPLAVTGEHVVGRDVDQPEPVRRGRGRPAAPGPVAFTA